MNNEIVSLDKALDSLVNVQYTKQEESFLTQLAAPDEATLFAQGLSELEPMLNVKFLVDVTASSSCLLRILVTTRPFNLPGLTFPPGFKYYRSPDTEEYIKLVMQWRKALARLDLKIAEFWFPVLSSGSKGVTRPIENYISQLAQISSMYESQHQGIQGYKQGIAISPGRLRDGVIPRAFVPEASWFSEKVRALKPSDIVTLMPEAELNLFMLFIGRVLAGRDNSVPVCGSVARLLHKFRKMVILYGKDPGTGKTTFCNVLNETLRMLGYVVATFNSIDGHFNMGDIYQSDLAFKDDTVQADIKSALHSSSFKSLVTGALMRVQNKGKDAYNVVSNCGVLMIANELNQAQLFGADTGVIDRLGILYTYSKAELNKLAQSQQGYAEGEASPDLRPFAHFKWLEAKTGADIHAIMAWFFRQSLDFFLASVRNETLEQDIASVTSHLEFPICYNAMPNVVSAMHIAMLLRVDSSMAEQALPPLTNKATLQYAMTCFSFLLGDNSAHIARCMIKDDWLAKGRPMNHPWMGVRSISPASLVQAILEASNLCQNKLATVDQAIKRSFSLLCTVQNISIGSGQSYVKLAWDDCISTSYRDELIALASSIHAAYSAQPVLAQAHKRMLGNSMADLSHTEEVGYDPAKHADKLHEEYLKQLEGNKQNA